MLFNEGKDTLDMAKILNRDHRTIQRYFNEGIFNRKKRETKGQKTLSSRQVRAIKLEMARRPHSSSFEIFEAAGVPGVPKSTRNNLLRGFAKVKKPKKSCPLTALHRKKRLDWVAANLKTNFENVLFTDECRATLDGPDGWASGWVLHQHEVKTRSRRQQGGGGVMIWAGIIGDQVLGPFMVEKGVKLNSEAYCSLLNQNFFPWYKKLTPSKKRSFIFQQDNAPSHVSQHTMDYLRKKGIGEPKIMVWPPNSPDLNPIENYWSILKREVYSNRRQFSTLGELWQGIEAAASSIPSSSVLNLTKSMDRRLLSCQGAKGYRIKY